MPPCPPTTPLPPSTPPRPPLRPGGFTSYHATFVVGVEKNDTVQKDLMLQTVLYMLNFTVEAAAVSITFNDTTTSGDPGRRRLRLSSARRRRMQAEIIITIEVTWQSQEDAAKGAKTLSEQLSEQLNSASTPFTVLKEPEATERFNLAPSQPPSPPRSRPQPF